MPYTVRIDDPKTRFSASHFLADHDKCSRIHGHNYDVSVEVSGNLNEKYFVVDFFELKMLVKKITDQLDHRLLLPENSKEIHFKEEGSQIKVDIGEKHYEFPRSDVVLLPIEATTAELISKFIHDKIKKEYIGYNVVVEVAESESSIAKYTE